MAIIQCEQGHYYDDEKYGACPHCAAHEGGPDGLTVAFAESEQIQDRLASMISDDGVTRGVFQSRMKADPVVGWLVCTEGAEKGRDYRIHAGRNFIGRSYKMDVSIPDDETVTRDNHCSLAFDPLHSAFLLAPGEGTGVLVNGKLLQEPVEIKNEDAIRIGSSEFVFMAFCGSARKWI
jgi:hypothetical protein